MKTNAIIERAAESAGITLKQAMEVLEAVVGKASASPAGFFSIPGLGSFWARHRPHPVRKLWRLRTLRGTSYRGGGVARSSTSAPLSRADLARAEAAIAAAVLPDAAERRAYSPSPLEVVAPALRNQGSGRLDARRVAEATGLSLAALARATGARQQTLSATPDSPGAQAALLPIARLSALLDEVFPSAAGKHAWLQTPHPRFGGRSPAQAIESGDAMRVTLLVENALDGQPA